MPPSDISVRLRLLGAKRFEQDAQKGGKAVDGIGRSATRSSRGLRNFDRSSSRTQRGFRGMARGAAGLIKPLAGVAAGYAGIATARSAVNTTTDLAKATIGLHKNLGLSVGKASEWAAVAKVRGIETKALNMSFGTLSKQSVAAAKGTEASADAFKQLGISQGEIKKLNFNDLLGAAADGLAKMKPGAERTALSMKLFGRGWQTVVPLLRDGSKGMREQLGLARKYGATFGGKSIRSMQDFISAQREQKFATLGLQLALGQFLIPTLTKGLGAVNKFVLQMRSGKGPGGDFAKVMKDIWEGAKPIVTWIGRAAVNVGKFGAKHPTITKLAVAIGAAGLAINAIRTSRAVRGIGTLLGSLRRLAKTKAGEQAASSILGGFKSLPGRLKRRVAPASTALQTTMGTAGTRAGAKASANTAASAASNMPASFSSRKGRFAAVGKNLGRTLGVAAGAAVAIPIVMELNDALNKWIDDREGAAGGRNVREDFGGTPGGGHNFLEGILGRQHGGPIRPGQTARVGETGPELVTARAGSAFVTPVRETYPRITSLPSRRPMPAVQPLGGGGVIHLDVHNVLEVDSQVLARSVTQHKRLLSDAVARDTGDRKARR